MGTKKFDYVFVVAPYCPPSRGGEVHLAASKKIEAVLLLANELSNKRVLLINSAHNKLGYRSSYFRRVNINGIAVIEFTPFTLPIKKLGKLLNLSMFFNIDIRRILWKRNKLVWLYNGYAFECIWALICGYRPKDKFVLEIEDSFDSRVRGGFDLKNKIDKYLFKMILKKTDIITFVNKDLKERFALKGYQKGFIFPSIISDDNIYSCDHSGSGKYLDKGKRVSIGYFGGLTPDKGSGLLVDIIKILPAEWDLVITGCGSSELEVKQACLGRSNVDFLGLVSSEVLLEKMSSIDLFLNPHSPIDEMANGVFPFKVCEYLSFRKIVVSTALPQLDSIIDSSYLVFDGTAVGFIGTVKEVLDDQDKLDIVMKKSVAGANYVKKNYSHSGVLDKLLTCLT